MKKRGYMNTDLHRDLDRYDTDYLIGRKKMGNALTPEAHATLDEILKQRGIAEPEKYGSSTSEAAMSKSNATAEVAGLFGRGLIIFTLIIATAIAAALFKEKLKHLTAGFSNEQFMWGLTAFVIAWGFYQLIRGIKNATKTMSRAGKIIQVLAYFTFSGLGIVLVLGTGFSVRSIEVPSSIEYVVALFWVYSTAMGARWLWEVFREA